MSLEGVAAAVVHPHPAMGGDSSHPFVVTAAALLRDKGATVITPDLHDPDVAVSAVELARLVDALDTDAAFLVGYSWGSVVASHAAPRNLVARVLVAPPAAMALGELSTPTLALIPENDQFGGPDAIALAAPATTEVVRGADHFLWGYVDQIAGRAVAWLTSQL